MKPSFLHRTRRPLALLLAWSLGAAPLMPAPALAQHNSAVRLPSLGESASDEFNLSAEKRLGEQIMRSIRPDPDYIDDPLLLEYVQSIWQPLVDAARVRGDITADIATLFPFEAFLVRDRSINAFALPGGYVGVHLGLVAMTATRDELASVLAHEFSHISQRHIARSMVANQRSSTLGMAAMILGILAASRSSNVDVAQAAVMGGQAAMLQSQLNFSRDMEREADRNGQSLMVLGGFQANGMSAMFTKLDQGMRLNDNGAYPYLRSHPLTVERIGEAQQRAGQLGAPTQPLPPSAARWHSLMQARAKVLMDPTVDSLRRAQELDARPAGLQTTQDERLAGLYSGALASIQLRDFARAERDITAAMALPGVRDDALVQRAFAPLNTQLALARGDLPGAERAAQQAGDRAKLRSALLLRAQVALASREPQSLAQSAEALQTWVSDHRQDALAWQALSHCDELLDQPLRSLRAAAEAQAALGNLQGAMDRLRAGQKLARQVGTKADFIESSVIDSRLRDLVAQRKELMAEQRRSGVRPDPNDEP